MTKDGQLLTAAFGDGGPARDAWAAWRDSVDIEVLEAAEEKVLPQLYRNLSAMGVRDAIVERLRSTYRHTWVANQLLLQSVARAVGSLTREGVDGRLVGDAALVLTAYGDLGARRIELAEVSVPPAGRRRALRVLTNDGWRTLGPGVRRQLRPLIRARQMLCDAEGHRLRLSWRTPRVDREPPIQAEVQGVRLPVPSALAQLAAACDVASAGSGLDLSRLADVVALTRAVAARVPPVPTA